MGKNNVQKHLKNQIKKGKSENDINITPEKEEDDIMAIAKRSPTIIIDKSKTQDFFSTLNKNIPTQQFWEDCKKLRESISSEDIDDMNNLIKKRLKND